MISRKIVGNLQWINPVLVINKNERQAKSPCQKKQKEVKDE